MLRQNALTTLILGISLVATVTGSAASRPNETRTRQPALPPGFMRGVNYANIHRRGHQYGSARSFAQLKRLKSVGVEWIAVTPFAYQRTVTSDRVVGFPGAAGKTAFFRRTDPTLTDQDLRRTIAHAHQLHMKVLIAPHIWSRAFQVSGKWHGDIHQTTVAAHKTWWNSYQHFVLHYAKLARHTHADAYCVGTELVMMTEQYPDQWRSLIGQVRHVYPGPVTYAANWGGEYARIPFWDACDFIGITAYFPLKVHRHATVAQLIDAWQPWIARIARVHRKFHKPIVFLEAGYRNVESSYRHPWTSDGGVRDDAAQANAYAALFAAWHKKPWWQGVFFWKTFTDPSAVDGDDGASFSFLHRPAERIVRKWYGSDQTTTALQQGKSK